MATGLEFETPENIRVAYEPAGLGTRYLAWFLDNILITLMIIVIVAGAVMLGLITDSMMESLKPQARKPDEVLRFVEYFVGFCILLWSFGGLVYFTCTELLLRGQTPGKRSLGLRVIRIDGFALDTSSIFVRNIFRLIDQFPPVWIVPFLSKRAQRFGDMAAGTTVVVDKPHEFSPIRKVLADLPPAEARYKFDAMALKRARAQDFTAIERVLNRWETLPSEQRMELLEQIVPPLVERLKVEPPIVEERLIFLQDLLAAEYRRQHRNL